MISEELNDFNIEEVDLKQKKQPQCRIMICQFSSEELDWENKEGLHILIYTTKIIDKVSFFLNVAKQNSVDLIIFPELSIPEKLIERIRDWSSEHEAIAICGSHYHKTAIGYISRSPFIINGDVYFTEKIKPAPIEKSPIAGEGLQSGSKILKFKNTQFGDIGILICSDYLDENLKKMIKISDLDILCVPSFQKDSNYYYRRMASDCENSNDGIYILFSNFYDTAYGDGGSALFGQMDRMFSNKLKEKKLTDLNPETKIFQFDPEIEYAVFDIDLKSKRPYVTRSIQTEPNIRLINSSLNINKANANFLKKISHNDDKYKWIDQYYVPPKEYEDIVESLKENNIVFITGDPGIGKTYTAIQLLKLYYENEYEPIWFTGLEKEEREVQSKVLNDFTPKDKQIVYFEDPFGKTAFEKRDSLYQVFGPLIDKLSQFDSKIIVTIRTEIFEKFTQESLLEDDLLNFKKELNVRNPSYGTSELKEIFNKLVKFYCSWYSLEDYNEIVYLAIENKKLSTPLAIWDLVLVSREVKSVEELQKKIENRESGIVTAFAHEIKQLPITTKVILYLVFLSGTKGHHFLSKVFIKVIDDLNSNGIKVDGYSFNIDLRTQLGYRIEQFGHLKSAYKLSHPFYEEALARLILKEPLSEIIVKSIIREYSKSENKAAYLAINKIVLKYPEVSLLLYKHLIEEQEEIQDIELKTLLSQKLISTFYYTKKLDFFELACRFFPLKKLVDDINQNSDDAKLLSLKLNLVERYLHNSPYEFDSTYSEYINWDKLFFNRFYKSRTANSLNHLLQICNSINPVSISKFIEYQSVSFIQQTYFLLDFHNRKRFYKLFKKTKIARYLRLYKTQIDNLEESGEKKSLKEFRKILYSEKIYRGKIIIDDGAAKAIKRFWANLLPVGIIEIIGSFEAGTIIGVFNKEDILIGAGMTEYSSRDLDTLKQHPSSSFSELLGFFHSNYAIRSELLQRLHFQNGENKKWRYIPETKLNKTR